MNKYFHFCKYFSVRCKLQEQYISMYIVLIVYSTSKYFQAVEM